MSANQPDDDRRRTGAHAWIRRHVLGRRARIDDVKFRKIELDPDIVMAALAITLVLLGIVVGFSLYQQNQIHTAQDDINVNQAKLVVQQKQLARLEERDRINSYQTGFRFCSRINIDRATLHWLTYDQIVSNATPETRERAVKFARMYRRRLEKKGGMPILDCDPNVTGGPATYMSPRRQREFVHRWATGRLTPAEIGICRIPIGKVTNPRACLK
jgi:hypothetical protein